MDPLVISFSGLGSHAELVIFFFDVAADVCRIERRLSQIAKRFYKLFALYETI